MRRFMALLKKEIKELLTPQMLIPLFIGVLVFVFIGKVMGNETKKANAPQKVAVLDLDNSLFSRYSIDSLKNNNFNAIVYTGKNIETVLEDAKQKNINIVMVIPYGYEKGIQEFKPQQIDTYSIIKNFSVTGSMAARSLKNVINAINQSVSSQMITVKAPSVNPEDIKNPIKTNDFVIIGNKKASISSEYVTNFITSQSTFIPIVMFLIIILSAQMIAVGIASEKENKTLETLLSTPVDRISIVSAKMVAAGLVSLLMAAVYMFGFKYYINSFTENTLKNASNSVASSAMKQLGLEMNTTGYILLGASLFFSILIALAISLILGAFADDVKKVQGLVAPLTFLVMIPYLLSIFIDLSTATPMLKYAVYAIPFSHPFLASPNLFLHKYTPVLLGIAYQAVLFLIFVIIAGRIFSSDKILTMKLDLRKRNLL